MRFGEKAMYKKISVSIFLTVLLFVVNSCENNNGKEFNVDQSNNPSKAIPVEAMVLNEKIIEQKFSLTGVLVPQNSVDIIAEVSGKIISINKNLGDFIEANQTLAAIDDVIPKSNFEQAEAQVLSSENNVKILKTNLESDKLLYENGDISKLQYENSVLGVKNAEAQYLSAVALLSVAKKNYDDTKIKSPISGFISRKNINIGTMVTTGTPVYRTVDLSKMKMEVSVPQEIINKVKIGDKAIITISALDGKTFDGIVKRISPEADKTTGAFMIEVLIDNKSNLIKAGMTAKLELLLTTQNKTLAIPHYSLVLKNGENYVYKISNGTAKLTEIEIGESMGENIIVKNGLDLKDTIVVVGMNNLGVNTKINIEELHY